MMISIALHIMDQERILGEKIHDALSPWQAYQIFQGLASEFQDLQFFLAGGVIRDVLLGRIAKPKDFDVFAPEQAVNLIIPLLRNRGRVLPGPFGSPRWYPGADEPYCDIVPIERFDVGLGCCGNIIEVLDQFDFTGNAIAFDLRTRSLIDPINGIHDLRNRIMRAVRFDYPAKPFAEGHVLSCRAILWFRILHYATVLKLDIEPETRHWLTENAECGADRDLFSNMFFTPETGALQSISEG